MRVGAASARKAASAVADGFGGRFPSLRDFVTYRQADGFGTWASTYREALLRNRNPAPDMQWLKSKHVDLSAPFCKHQGILWRQIATAPEVPCVWRHVTLQVRFAVLWLLPGA